MIGGDNGVFYTVGNHEEAVMTIEQRLEWLERLLDEGLCVPAKPVADGLREYVESLIT